MKHVDTETELTDQQKMSQGLRELADFLDEHPALTPRGFTFYKSNRTREGFIDLAQQLGSFQKEVTDNYYNLNRHFGPITLQLYCDREVVCTKRIEMQEVEVWDCPEHLLSDNEKKEPDHADGN